MAETARRRRRWPWVVAAGLVVVAIVAFWQLRSEKLARTILDRVGPAVGLELDFDGEPSYTLTPEPTLTLPGFTAKQPGADVPLLKADRLKVSLPWETIRGAEAREITRVELDAPVLDLDALAAWQAARPDTPFEVPTLTQGLAVQDGTIVGDGWRLVDVDLSLPELRDGARVDAELAARFERGTLAVAFDGDVELARAGLVTPVSLDLDGTLATGDGTPMPWALTLKGELDADRVGEDSTRANAPITLTADAAHATGTFDVGEKAAKWTLDSDLALAIGDATTLDLHDAAFRGDEPLPELLFDGHVAAADALRIDLGGALARWPGGWPTLPPPLDGDVPMPFVLGYAGASDLSDPLRLRVQRGGTTLDARAVVPDVLAWMDAPDRSPLPPIEGLFETPKLTFGAFTLDGVRVEFEDDGVDDDDADDDGADAAADDEFADVEASTTSSEPRADTMP